MGRYMVAWRSVSGWVAYAHTTSTQREHDDTTGARANAVAVSWQSHPTYFEGMRYDHIDDDGPVL